MNGHSFTAIDIRERYLHFFVKNGFTTLPELALSDPVHHNNPYFISSALVPNLAQILNEDSKANTRKCAVQRCFRTRYLDYIGHSPFATPCEVMMSFYLLNSYDLSAGLSLAIQLLTEVYGIPRDNLLLLTHNSEDTITQAMRSGLSRNQLVPWKNRIPFSASELLRGYYCRFFVQHRHGLIPIFDIIYALSNTANVIIDSCMLLERMTFVLQGKRTWYDTELFAPLISSIYHRHPHLKYEAVSALSVLMRSIVMLLADGVSTAGKGREHALRKLIRKLLHTAHANTHSFDPSEFVDPTLICLKNLGYTWEDESSRIKEILTSERVLFEKMLSKNMSFLKKIVRDVIEKGTHISGEHLEKWWSSRGIHKEFARSILSKSGIDVDGFSHDNRTLPFTLTDGYSFDERNVIHDPTAWLRNAEHKYFADRT